MFEIELYLSILIFLPSFLNNWNVLNFKISLSSLSLSLYIYIYMHLFFPISAFFLKFSYLLSSHLFLLHFTDVSWLEIISHSYSSGWWACRCYTLILVTKTFFFLLKFCQVSTQPLHYGCEDMTQGQFLREVHLVWIQSCLSAKLLALNQG